VSTCKAWRRPRSLKCDRGRVLAKAVIIEVRQRSCVKFGRGRVKASVTEVKL